MFNFSFGELLVIGVIALLVLGPDKLPGAARTAGLWIGKIRRTVGNLQSEITSQLEAEELRRELNDQRRRIDGGAARARKGLERFSAEFSARKAAPARPPSVSDEVRPAPLPPLRPPSRPVIAREALDAPLPGAEPFEKSQADSSRARPADASSPAQPSAE